MDRYEAVFDLPVLSPAFEEIGDRAAARLRACEADIEAALDIESGVVTVRSDSGVPYGPRLIAKAELPADDPQMFALAPGTVTAAPSADAATIGGPLLGVAPQDRARSMVGRGYETVLRFDTVDLGSTLEFGLLRLPAVRVSGSAPEVSAELFLVTEAWVGAEATWLESSTGVAWGTGGGAAVDPTTCVGATLVDGQATLVDWPPRG